jgi:glyoxylase-like metal-dependent hydrolase (beta-lactamase superfamily II)
MEAGGFGVEPLRFGAVEMQPEHLGPAGAYPGPVQTPVYGFLLRGHGETVLVDAGSGPFDPWWVGAAGLDEALAAAGVARSEVTRIVLTHLDFDHAGGVVAGDPDGPLEPAFPGIPVVLADERLDWWRARTDENAGTPVLRAVEAAGVAVPAADGEEVLPGVVLRLAPGHRAGHACLQIGGPNGVVIGADLVHHPLHVPHPSWDGAMDFDPATGLATRLAWFGRLADDGPRVHFSHVDGFGVVERDGDGYRWSPA